MTRGTRKALALMGGSSTWKPTDEDRKRVRMYVWAGQPPHKIAEFMRITEPELRYHFFEEMGVQQADMVNRITAGIEHMIAAEDTPPKIRADLLKYLGDRKVPAFAPKKAAEVEAPVIPEASKRLEVYTKDELYARLAELRAKKEEPSDPS